MKRIKKECIVFLCLMLILCGNLGVFAADIIMNPGESWGAYQQRVYNARKTEFDALQTANAGNTVPADEVWTLNAMQEATDGDGNGLVDVYTAAQLRWALVNKKSLELKNDVDLGGRNPANNWSPVADPGSITIEGNGHTIYNLYTAGSGKMGMISTVDRGSADFKMQNLRFRYCHVESSGQYSGVAVGWLLAGKMKQVSVEDSIVHGAAHTGGIVSGWNGDGSTSLNSFFVHMDQCHVRNVTTYGTSCVGSFVGPVSGYKITNSYSIDSYDISTSSHSGGFISCPGNCWIENCFTNVKLYCNTDGGVFYGIGHYANHFENCFASGVVEGSSNVGGFFGRDEQNTDTCINCYSTSMVGMQNTASTMGGFYGGATGDTRIQNCYSTGEVGTTKTKPGASGSTLGGIGGNNPGAATFSNCYFDKQTSGMGEYAIGTLTHNSFAGITGYLTGQMIGDAMKEEFGTDGTWTYQSGVYPQLSVFTNPSESFGNETDRAIAKAYSAASVCTALLQPSNLNKTQEELEGFSTTDYDTVRNISVLFPLTNNRLAGYDGSGFDISWETRDGYTCQLPGDMNGLPVITLDPKTYETTNFAPGVGWTDVSVSTGITNPQNGEEIVGQRFMRLVPTTVISLANGSAGVDQYIYVKKDNRLPDEATKYDHRESVIFALGSATDVDTGSIRTTPYPADDTTFGYDETGTPVGTELTGTGTVGGKVIVKVSKLNEATGKYEDQHIESNEELQKLLLNQRSAEEKDKGVYKLQYEWYKSGNLEGGCIVNSKTLTVREVLTLAYDKNYPEPTGGTRVEKDDYPYVVGQSVNDAAQNFPESPEMKGYTFMGWSTDPKANPERFDAFTADTKLKDDTVAYAVWKMNTYDVTTAKTGQGTISSSESYKYKENATVTWEPAEGWRVSSVMVDGIIRDDLLPADGCKFVSIDANHKVQVRFEEGTADDDETAGGSFVSVATSTEGLGSISEAKTLKKGGDYTVSWKPADGWKVKEVWIDGENAEALKDVGEIAFQDAAVNHTVHVVYVREDGSSLDADQVCVVETSVAEGEGTITATGQVQKGEDHTVTWEAGKGYKVVEVTVDGEVRPDLLNAGNVTFEAVDKDHTVQVKLKKKPSLIIIDSDDNPGGEEPDDKPDDNPDINKDTDGDGKPDINIDTDGDGKPDVDIDTNGDDKPDINIDTDGDGKPDINKDTDGDGKPDVDIDTNGDGKPDINKDTDGDGKPDLDIDTNGDGKPDVNIDTDGDGKPDINVDTNGDGKPDVNKDTDGDGKPDIDIDTDGDGKPDINIDTNKDGKPDLNIDTDGDGKPDINIDTDGDGIPDLNVDIDGDGKPDTNIDTDGDGKPDENVKTPSEIDKLIKDNNKEDQNAGNKTNDDEEDELPWWIPRTGDTSNMLTWLAILATALLALTGMIACVEKKRESK
ncbi:MULTISPECIES: InlB B-repeat-containing protein [Anaerotruncus]|uniref:InlB B-repeat-containing protein n=1 Tax=Anaerotruncus TaxID=244127 RepID=UPI00191C275E|nr:MULTISPECIES: hypothetical protein [Anaerotruncus]